MTERPAPGVTVRLVSRTGTPLGVVSDYDRRGRCPYLPVEDQYGVTRLYAPEDVEPAPGPALVRRRGPGPSAHRTDSRCPHRPGRSR